MVVGLPELGEQLVDLVDPDGARAVTHEESVVVARVGPEDGLDEARSGRPCGTARVVRVRGCINLDGHPGPGLRTAPLLGVIDADEEAGHPSQSVALGRVHCHQTGVLTAGGLGVMEVDHFHAGFQRGRCRGFDGVDAALVLCLAQPGESLTEDVADHVVAVGRRRVVHVDGERASIAEHWLSSLSPPPW